MDNSTDEIAFKGKGNTFIKDYFKEWDGYSLLCPDSDVKTLNLSGSEVSTNSSSLIFEVNRCNNS